MRQFSTPMMQQYIQIREQYPDCMLFFRLGDFYELFLDDAIEGAKILGITLTRRPRGKDGDIPMAGVPFHSANTYINKLLRSGKKIAVCEQVSEPDSRGIVDRKVIRIITPGTVLDDASLEQKKHNFVASVSIGTHTIGVAAADLLTGEFTVCELERNGHDTEHVGSELMRLSPSECIVSLQTYNTPELLKIVTTYHQSSVAYFHEWEAVTKQAESKLTAHFSVPSLGVFGLTHMQEATTAAAVLVSYLNHTQQRKVTHLNFPTVYSPQQTVLLDPATLSNLEVFSTLQEQSTKGSLFTILDKTQSAMGGRLLRSWIHNPLKDKHALQERYEVIDELYKKFSIREEVQKELQEIFDIQRLSSKLSLKLGTAASILNIKQSLQTFMKLVPVVNALQSPVFKRWKELPIKIIREVVADIEKNLVEKFDTDESGIIKEGVNSELDELRKIFYSGKDWVAQFEIQERKRTKIGSLKCRYNQVFGFYIEVSQSNLHLIPSDYIRKQTLVNAERFITPELKKQEELILTAESKIAQIEKQLFEELTERIVAQLESIKKISYALAELDVFCSLSQLAQENRYIQPSLNTNGTIEIYGGKHPVLARVLQEKYVPNDVVLNTAENQLLIITGPNMAGKSVYMRQVAVLVLLAHIGSFVPADSAEISIVDRIFVRSGASDNISKGLSTFMVEMVEAAHILHQATSDSLVIMDEIGRGTSTYDGISIAWAIAEYLVTEPTKKPRVLFATHYHELQALEARYPEHIKNYQVMVQEHNGKPVFLYTVQPGAASHSFGIAVAKLAGLPEQVLESATVMLQKLESTHQTVIPTAKKNKSSTDVKVSTTEKSISDVISNLDINTLTPIDALTTLVKLQKQVLQK